MKVKNPGDIPLETLSLTSESHLDGARWYPHSLGDPRHALDTPTITRRAFCNPFAPYHESEIANRDDIQYR